MNDYESLSQLDDWAKEVDENALANTVKIVACSKCDNIDDEEVVPKQEGQEYAKRINA